MPLHNTAARALSALLGLIFVLPAAAEDRPGAAGGGSPAVVTWYDGHRPRTFAESPVEVAVLGRPSGFGGIALPDAARTLFPGGEVVEAKQGMVRLRLSRELGAGELDMAGRTARAYPNVDLVSPVYRSEGTADPSLPGYVFSGAMVVQFEEPTGLVEAADWGAFRRLELLRRTVVEDAYLYACPPDERCVEQANRAYREPGVRYAYPDWLKPRGKRAFMPNDPLYPNQWHLENTGQSGGTSGEDVNIQGAWMDYDGAGVTIAVVDDALQIGHPDISPNVLAGMSWDYVNEDTDPSPTNSLDSHGTPVAGVAAARGGNVLGVSGAAPLASLVGFNLLQVTGDSYEADALRRAEDVVDISSNSWGPFDSSDYYAGPGPLTAQALEDGAMLGRGGKGTIYVWAAGNGYDTDNANFDGYANSRFTIAVAASDHNGNRSSYSERGANLHVNAPSDGAGVGIVTTDLIGGDGYNGLPDDDYTNQFGGTSSATPLVSGIVALMLEANPALTWRDVQAVLMTTAEKNDPTDPRWSQNAAGHWFNYYYGFGRVDASAAVAAAETWTLLGPEVTDSASASPGIAIPDDDPVGISVTLDLDEYIRVESVEVDFQTDHTYGGDLGIELTSPEGTEAQLSHIIGSNNSDPGSWTFSATKFFGETSQGTWTLSISDYFSPDSGTLQSWGIRVHGTACGVNDDNLVLDALNVSGSLTREACGSIDVQDVVVQNGGSLTLRASQHVSFQAGFNAKTGGELAVDMTLP